MSSYCERSVPTARCSVNNKGLIQSFHMPVTSLASSNSIWPKYFYFFCSALEDMQWSDPRPRHIRDPKTRAQEDTLQVAHANFGFKNELH